MPQAPPGFEIIRELGIGGMGAVYLAREIVSERLVAIKFLQRPGHQGAFDRFGVEVKALGALDHPNIIRFYSSDFLRSNPYFTTEYASGGCLLKKLEAEGPLDQKEAARLMAIVARAIHAAHSAKVIHRDLKPSNIVLMGDGLPKVSDFGLAKRLDRNDDLTTGTGPLGSPPYMAPEQTGRDEGNLDGRTDVYGLGATLYHLVTGRRPFTGLVDEVIRQVQNDLPYPPRSLRRDIPRELEAIILKCLEKDPARRYQSAEALAVDLDRFVAGQVVEAPLLTWPRRVRQSLRRNRRRIATAIATVAAMVSVAVIAIAATRPAKPTEPPDPPRDRLKEIRQELIAGRSVTLIGKNGEPIWFDAPTGPIKFGENPTGTGGCYFPAYSFTALRLLEPPIDRYTVELDLQHVKSEPARARSEKPSLGFMLNYSHAIRPDDWAEQSFLSVGFNDLDRGRIDGPPSPSAVKVESYCYVNAPGRSAGQTMLPFGIELPLEAGKILPGRWRKLVAKVEPNRVRIDWEPTPDQRVPLADLSLADLRSRRTMHDTILKVGGKQFGHVFAPLPEWSPNRGIGVWAEGAEIAVRNFAVSPN